MHCTLFFRDSGPCACSHIVSAGVSGTTLSQCQSNYAIDSIFRRVSFDIKKYRIAETRARGVDRSARAETHDANNQQSQRLQTPIRPKSRIPDAQISAGLSRYFIALTNTQIKKRKLTTSITTIKPSPTSCAGWTLVLSFLSKGMHTSRSSSTRLQHLSTAHTAGGKVRCCVACAQPC